MDRSHPRRRACSRLAGASLLLTIIGLLAGCALPWVPAYSSSSSRIDSHPAPPAYVWRQVIPPPATPQEAFTAGVSQLKLCLASSIPARSVTTTWLVAGPTYGVVLLRADCSNQPQDTRQGIAILPIARDKDAPPKCSAWVLGNGGIVTRQLPADAKLSPMAYQIPSWLPLPNGTYQPETLGGGIVPSALFSLESSTRLFITGRFAGSATQPAGVETVNVGGRSGWQVSDQGIVTVTLPLADGWTFYFSGTADAATMRSLASASLSHLDTLLPRPPSLQAPAC
ncbi:MAG TPA: hypothetical protein VF040_18580 [Ktedonobacterales bacterium]